MDISSPAVLLSELIGIPSLTGKEEAALVCLERWFTSWGWRYQRIPVCEGRWNILVSFGVPRVLFTTHVDVVPGPEEAFHPRQEGGRIFGRGACDAKGALVAMIHALHQLRSQDCTDLALLVVVGEEVDGIGALTAAEHLRGQGIEYLVDGEPTEGRLMRGHRGVIETVLRCKGRACHSGYPELGVDANKKLIQVLARVLQHELPHDPEFGPTTVNIGIIAGGVATNVVSPHATAQVSIRMGCPSREVIDSLARCVGDEASLEVLGAWEPVQCVTVPGFELGIASYATDIPSFKALEARPLLYGPGSIHHAHTDSEFVNEKELTEAVHGYARIYHALH